MCIMLSLPQAQAVSNQDLATALQVLQGTVSSSQNVLITVVSIIVTLVGIVIPLYIGWQQSKRYKQLDDLKANQADLQTQFATNIRVLKEETERDRTRFEEEHGKARDTIARLAATVAEEQQELAATTSAAKASVEEFRRLEKIARKGLRVQSWASMNLAVHANAPVAAIVFGAIYFDQMLAQQNFVEADSAAVWLINRLTNYLPQQNQDDASLIWGVLGTTIANAQADEAFRSLYQQSLADITMAATRFCKQHNMSPIAQADRHP